MSPQFFSLLFFLCRLISALYLLFLSSPLLMSKWMVDCSRKSITLNDGTHPWLQCIKYMFFSYEWVYHFMLLDYSVTVESVLPFKPEVIDQNLMQGTYTWLLTLTDKFANKYQSSLSNWSHFHFHLAALLWCVFSDLFTPNSKRIKIRTFAPGCVPMSFFLYLYIDKKKKKRSF